MSSKAPAPDAAAAVARLSERERAVLALLARGHDGRSAAAALGISRNAVNVRLREAERKLGRGGIGEAVRLLAAAAPDAREARPAVHPARSRGAASGRSRGNAERPALWLLSALLLVAVVAGCLELWGIAH